MLHWLLPYAVSLSFFFCCFLCPGASDACSCICIELELARTLVANPKLQLAAPVVFLFNGGEETLSQASNGFFASSRWGCRRCVWKGGWGG